MDYNTECPYCHKKICEMIAPYSHENQIYGYLFFCDCRNDKTDERFNEEEAYRVYLEKRING